MSDSNITVAELAKMAGKSRQWAYSKISDSKFDKYITVDEDGKKLVNIGILEDLGISDSVKESDKDFTELDKLKEEMSVKDERIKELEKEVKDLTASLLKMSNSLSSQNDRIIELVSQAQELNRNTQVLFKQALPVPEQPGGQAQEGAASPDEKQPEAPTKKRKWFWQK